MYTLKDSDGDVVKGAFYEHELQKITLKPQVSIFEKILKTRGTKPNRQYLMKWQNKPLSMASWVHEKNIV